ncbi:MAG TPA: acyltransferase family protein [Ktedonobacterales bacterium]|jgi:peptidoglycan/LPS O-acetylase OafA/YrhL
MCASTLAARSAPAIRSARHVRRHELDWLRTAAVFGLIPFHTAIIFTSGSYDYIKNAQPSALMDALTAFVSLWGIPVLFLVAGGAARYALAVRGPARYLNERVMRLLIPFTFGMLLIVPLQIYIGRLSASAPPPSLPGFYLAFLLTLLGVFAGHFPPGPEWIGHLWFIPPLMVFSALAVPFARLLRTVRGQRTLGWLAGAPRGVVALAVLGAPLAAVQLVTQLGDALFPSVTTPFGANAIGIVAYLIFFLAGYVIYLDEGLLASVRRYAWPALALGTISWLVIAFVAPGRWPSGAPVLASALAVARGYCAWWWVMGILGLAVRFLQFTTPAVEYLSRAAYPVYIIHMPILSYIGLWVVRLDMNVWLKFGLITVLAVAASLAVYDLLIRRIGALRLLFGLRANTSAGVRNAI